MNRARLFVLVALVAEASAAAQPASVKFTIAAAKTAWFLGETVPLQLSFTTSAPDAFSAQTRTEDRVGRMNGVEEFMVDPAAGAEDPLQGIPGGSGGMGGLSGGPIILSEKPFSFERILNEWVRFRRPGTYRVWVVSHRVQPAAQAARPPLELESNVITLEVLPAPPDWVRQQIAQAVQILDSPDAPLDQAVQKERQQAGRTLRFLDTPAAARELLKHLNGGRGLDTFLLYSGVLGSHYRAQLLPLMEQRLIAPDQPVWSRYLDTMAELSRLISPGGPKREEYVSRLLGALGAKQPAARAVCLNSLLESIERTPSVPSWRQSVVNSLVADFRNLPPQIQRDLLEYRWGELRGPAMLPVLREIYAHPPARFDPAMDDTALRRLYELAPQEARNLILDEIRHPTKHLRLATLAMLPDPTLPELDKFFLSELESGHADDRLVVRYATGAILEAAETAYQRRNLTQCATPLVYYFLRYDPIFGEKEWRRSFASTNSPPVCYDIGLQFQQLGRYAMSPALEGLAIEYLKHPAVTVRRGAAEVLGKFGSTAAQGPLWQAMAAFHAEWKDREAPQADAGLERALRIALGQGDGWVLDGPGLNRLMALCSGDWCKSEVISWLSVAKAPAEISVQMMSDGFVFNVAQYSNLTAREMRHKLVEYPLGTDFKVAVSSMEATMPEMKQARENAEKAVRESGHKLAG
jgi:hypothetical protein